VVLQFAFEANDSEVGLGPAPAEHQIMNVFSLVRENPEIIVNFPSQSSATVGQLPVKSPSSVLFFTTPHLLFGSVSVQTMRMKVSSFEVMNLQNVVCQQGASILW
jgi:hypothetical protein